VSAADPDPVPAAVAAAINARGYALRVQPLAAEGAPPAKWTWAPGGPVVRPEWRVRVDARDVSCFGQATGDSPRAALRLALQRLSVDESSMTRLRLRGLGHTERSARAAAERAAAAVRSLLAEVERLWPGNDGEDVENPAPAAV